ncbi:MAG: T9SS type A sorting domain-containing protein [Candidatus Zixiibacteriota bacterium]
MMHKRTLHSLLIVSFIVALSSTLLAADAVIVQDKPGLLRCVDQSATVTANIDAPISALEVVLQATNNTVIENVTVTWNLPAGVLTDRFIDLTQYPLIRFAAINTSGDPSEDYGAGTGRAVATINFRTKNVCSGTVDIEGAIWPSAPPFGVIQTQFVDAGTGDIRLAAVTSGTISVANDDPTVGDITGGPFTILHGTLFQRTLTATDDDVANGCETLTFFLQQGPAGMTVVGNTLSWTPTGAQVCQYDGDIIVGVRDNCQAQDLSAPFRICVTNNPPAFTDVPAATNEINYGQTFSYDIDAVDPDPGPYGPFYNLVGWSYPQTPPTVDANTGELVWDTGLDLPFGGVFNISVAVNDGAAICECAPNNADTVTFQVTVYLLQVHIAKAERVFIGQPVVVPVTISDISFFNAEIGGFDILIQYDNSAMILQFADEGSFLTDCEWEYFTYRFGPYGNCGPGACPSGVVRVVALGETTGGNLAHHPTCWSVEPGMELFSLHFLVSNDANLECQFAPIRFIWYDCADNGLSSRDGAIFYMSEYVWDFAGFDPGGDPIFTDITGLDQTMPTLTGAPSPECDVFTQKGRPWRLVHFRNGGLDLICADSIDAVGDINLNSIAYEIADAVMFTNYFINGLAAFGTHVEGSIAASDTNKDGITLSVADLVYLIRVIVGDALPYDKISPVAARITYGGGIFSVDRPMGAGYIVVSGDVTPTLLAGNMEMVYGYNGENTNILVWSREGNSFSGTFLRVDGQVVKTEFATDMGQPVVAKVVPADFSLSQNYPNPFNPSTKIDIAIPGIGVEWKLNIYNITGQLVESFSGVANDEFQTVIWDASDVSSGVYFYKLTAGNFSDTKKAVFLK